MIEMNKLIVGNKEYEVVDAVARAAAPQKRTISNQKVVNFTDGADNVPITNLKAYIEPDMWGEGTPGIYNVWGLGEGYTGVDFRFSNKNVWGGEVMKNDILAVLPSATVDNVNKTITFAHNAMNVDPYYFVQDIFKPETQYTIILTYSKNSGLNSNIYVAEGDNFGSADQYSIPSVSSTGTKETVIFTTYEGDTLFYIGKESRSGDTTIYYEESGVFEGVLTAADFEAFVGSTKSISFGQTVHQGEVNALTGEVLSTKGYASFDGSVETWTYDDSGNIPFFYTPKGIIPEGSLTFCTNLEATATDTETVGTCFVDNTNLVCYVDSQDIGDLSSWLYYLEDYPLTILYDITPQTISCTPLSNVNTLQGNNTINASTGNIKELSYYKTGCEPLIEFINLITLS